MKQQTLFLALFLCLMHFPGFAQNSTTDVWNPLRENGITGASFKIQPGAFHSRLLLGLRAAGQPGQTSGDIATLNQIEASLLRSPELREQLLEGLGGAFWFGTPSQAAAGNPVQSGKAVLFGVQAIVPLGRRFAVQAAVSAGKYQRTAGFPVTVFDQQHGQTRQTGGTLRCESGILEFEGAGRCYLLSAGFVRPFAGAGLMVGQHKPGATEVELSGVHWTIERGAGKTKFGLSFPAGFIFEPRSWPVFAEVGAALRFTPGESPNCSGTVYTSLGWRF